MTRPITARIAYQGNAMVSVLNVVSQTQMVAIVALVGK